MLDKRITDIQSIKHSIRNSKQMTCETEIRVGNNMAEWRKEEELWEPMP